ncbi:DUF423 domain-containing protein [Methylobacterium planeticum]|uniref:DUF423 domain-containing protein n=1 Tax=Methylobacterium planeticum TaxID=2615211 RepID=A0A6N6MX98_9HYPH|nr:DUF423 domain-containing protein [Methylobacterium planeticum]KAB1076331.1 DUF423 domain-containing protein [Methylobacterium planeticum]
MALPERLILGLAGLAGLLGVAASAAAAHRAEAESLRIAAQFLLFHAPALVGLAALAGGGLIRVPLTRIAAAALGLGLVLFCGDLSMRALARTPLFPMAAPSGGLLLMAGWLLVAVSGLLRTR